MADPTSLKERATQRHAQLEAQQTAVQTAVDAKHVEFMNNQQGHQTLVQELATLEKNIREARKSLANALMPSDAEAALNELRALIIQNRRKRREVLDREDAVAAAKTELKLLQADQVEVALRFKAATTELAAATVRDDLHKKWQQQLAEDPLSEIRADAANVLTPPTNEPDEEKLKKIIAYQNAKTRVEQDIPESLRLRATSRGQQMDLQLNAIRLASSEADVLFATHLKNTLGPDANVEKLLAEYLSAESRLGAYLNHALERVAAAISLANQINSSTQLTLAEHEEINGTSNPGLVTDGEAAADKEKDRDEKQQAVVIAATALQNKIAELRATDIDVDLSASTEVTDLQDDLTTAEAELTTAQAALTPELKNSLDQWEAAVPDLIWSNLLRFNTGTQILTELKDSDPAALTADMDAAETDLLAGLKSADKNLRTFKFLNDYKDYGQLRLRRAEQTHQVRVLTAVRGDQ